MVEVEGRAYGVKKFLSTFMQAYVALGSANKNCIGKSVLVIKGMAVLFFYTKNGHVRIKLRQVQIHRNTL